MRIAFRVVLVLVSVYLVLALGLFTAMCQKPGVFNQIMARVPGVAFIAFPFRPMWMRARAGALKAGDDAPDFSLAAYDGKSTVELSEFRGEKPVVLVFGSYT